MSFSGSNRPSLSCSTLPRCAVMRLVLLEAVESQQQVSPQAGKSSLLQQSSTPPCVTWQPPWPRQTSTDLAPIHAPVSCTALGPGSSVCHSAWAHPLDPQYCLGAPWPHTRQHRVGSDSAPVGHGHAAGVGVLYRTQGPSACLCILFQRVLRGVWGTRSDGVDLEGPGFQFQ